MYKKYIDVVSGVIDTKVIIRKQDNAFIPTNPDNKDYQEYLEWLSEGNTPEEAE